MNAILRSPRMHLACLLLCCLLALTVCDVKKTSTRTKSGDTAMLRNQIPPLFNPHRTSFICVYRDAVVQPVDPMAEALVQEAQWVEWNGGSPSWEKDKLWPHIIELNRRAAALGSWKARLNLVNLRLEGHGEQCGLPRDSEAAVREVEAEMARGIPDAWETMGRFYEQGIGVNPSSTKAYAFYQRAAEMGSPAAQTFLGKQLDATYDDPKAGFWGNEVIGRQMLECAVAQGYGPAAYELGISLGVGGIRNPADKARGLQVYHAGVKMGNADCANALATDFRNPQGSTSVAPLGVDLSRSERYDSIGNSLQWYSGSGLTLPNLDKILPLPPARLPPWDGNRDSLIEAARPVRVLNNTPPPTYPAAPSAGQSRRVLPEPYIFLQGGARPTAQKQAPQSGYWQARYLPHYLVGLAMTDRNMDSSSYPLAPPSYFFAGEPFVMPPDAEEYPQRSKIFWRSCPTGLPSPPPMPRVIHGLERGMAFPRTLVRRYGDSTCPATGVWQARMNPDHPLANLVNGNPLRQCWVMAGDAMPDPQRDWLVADGLIAHDLVWRFLVKA